MIGIILAGGTGSRLSPITNAVNKHLIPIYDKPMIFYPLATLLSAGIKEILIITRPNDLELFTNLLGDGHALGVSINYGVQPNPGGLAEAFVIGKEFIAERPSCLILGDNVFHGSGLGRQLVEHHNVQGAHIFAYKVSNPEAYGVVQFGQSGEVISIEEKPKNPKSNYAIPGIYFFDKKVSEIASQVKPSSRGEREISEVLNEYLNHKQLNVTVLPRGTAWLDTGSFTSLNDASNFIRIIEERQGQQIANLPEISWRQGWISNQELAEIAESSNSYNSSYLNDLLRNDSEREW
jgi:glucose-1-phosphate thymidylyltransferase